MINLKGFISFEPLNLVYRARLSPLLINKKGLAKVMTELQVTTKAKIRKLYKYIQPVTLLFTAYWLYQLLLKTYSYGFIKL